MLVYLAKLDLKQCENNKKIEELKQGVEFRKRQKNEQISQRIIEKR